MGIEEQIEGYRQQTEDDYEWWMISDGDLDDLMESFSSLWYWIDMERMVNK